MKEKFDHVNAPFTAAIFGGFTYIAQVMRYSIPESSMPVIFFG
jgi:hypothetical protein